MSYAEMLAALYAARRFGVRFGLERMHDALARLGHPERSLGAVIHIGGTNGKGSTAAMVDAMLRAAGHRTGLFTSPHLSRFTERIRIAGAEVRPDALARLYPRVPGELTFFEQATLLALLAFAEAEIDVCVLEVGLGGRLDATTAVPADVAAVTGVALDHQDVLGATLADIAAEKAGIFEAGRPAVIGRGGEEEGLELLIAEALRRRASPITVVAAPLPPDVSLALAGAHQRWNAACAVAALDASRLAVPDGARREGLSRVVWPGRMERMGDVLLDAAHNPHGARALAAALGPDPVAAVAAVSADKDAAQVIAPIAARAALVVATEAPSPRALPAAELARRVAAGAPAVPVVVEPDPRAALARARASGHPVVVFGSLFLVGAVRAHLLGEATDPLIVQDPPR